MSQRESASAGVAQVQRAVDVLLAERLAQRQVQSHRRLRPAPVMRQRAQVLAVLLLQRAGEQQLAQLLAPAVGIDVQLAASGCVEAVDAARHRLTWLPSRSPLPAA